MDIELTDETLQGLSPKIVPLSTEESIFAILEGPCENKVFVINNISVVDVDGENGEKVPAIHIDFSEILESDDQPQSEGLDVVVQNFIQHVFESWLKGLEENEQ